MPRLGGYDNRWTHRCADRGFAYRSDCAVLVNVFRTLLACNLTLCAFDVAISTVTPAPWLAAIGAAVTGAGAGVAAQVLIEERRR